MNGKGPDILNLNIQRHNVSNIWGSVLPFIIQIEFAGTALWSWFGRYEN
jgi:hypothetical protein